MRGEVGGRVEVWKLTTRREVRATEVRWRMVCRQRRHAGPAPHPSHAMKFPSPPHHTHRTLALLPFLNHSHSCSHSLMFTLLFTLTPVHTHSCSHSLLFTLLLMCALSPTHEGPLPPTSAPPPTRGGGGGGMHPPQTAQW